MDNKDKDKNKVTKTGPDASNDRLGENASEEFARDYDNKGQTEKSRKK